MLKNEIIGEIGIIKLNRPEKRNSLHPEMVKEFISVINDFNCDSQIKVIIITGEGESFCAGADLSYLNELRKNSVLANEDDSKLLVSFFLSVYESSKPTIAAVNGSAIAGGCGLATSCDFIFADEEKSKFGYSEVKIGFLPAIVSFLLLRRVSEFKARQILLSAEIMDAKSAQKIGLVEYLSSKGEALNDSLQFANELCKNNSFSMSETKKMIRQIYSMRYDDAVKYCLNLNVIGRTSEEFHKGLDKFLTKY
jgi:methylglutaconyl-CoA hydratase